MNKETLIKYLDGIDQETQITINVPRYNKIEFVKERVIYKIENKKTLVILKKWTNELYLINIPSIRSIKFDGKKSGVNIWIKNTESIVNDKKEKIRV